MNLNVLDRGQLDHIIKQTLNFFGKTPNRDALEIWEDALEKETLADIAKAFKLHIRKGRYAPVPADILGYISEFKEQRRGKGNFIALPTGPLPSNDHLMNVMEKAMDAGSFFCYQELALHALTECPELELARINWKLMWVAMQVKKKHISMAKGKEWFKSGKREKRESRGMSA